jgi:hypothetical protein
MLPLATGGCVGARPNAPFQTNGLVFGLFGSEADDHRTHNTIPGRL